MADKKAEALKIVEDEVGIPTPSRAEHEAWFDGNIHHYRTLAAMVAATLKSTLDGHGISYVDIPYREKGKKSFLKKIDDKKKKKDYSPSDMTDLAGIRVITLIESDVQKVGELIHSLFHVHPEDSIDKSASLGEDKVGYRSVHFVCDIGETREKLLEWKALKGLCFEIQVRTALEHAWAEIEHDRGYKLGGKLPSHLTRRFSLLSGLLESADLEFNRLTVEIEEYAENLKSNIKNDTPLKTELTSVGIETLIKEKYNQYISLDDYNFDSELIDIVLTELLAFGIKNLYELDKLIKKVEPFLYFNTDIDNTVLGFLRNVMMLNDIDKYFEKSWIMNEVPWRYIDQPATQQLNKKYGIDKINSIFEKYNLGIEDF
ncbi:GTP pyrophosphokinase [Acinetobacter tandoii]|uniref:GTP pyrophosphokinase n=1 Tax=Acinetobacter tandoii TaxID=202954 RepID=UPI004045DA8C